jgi:demethylmenaquinone methyltransferase/2-methoxy-6-polyprenyl-1,4-benzoquinol methylase
MNQETEARSQVLPETLPTGETKVAMVRAMFDTIAPRYDLVNRLMTFGLDLAWRRKAVDFLGLPPGSVVLDLACGTGDFCKILKARHIRAIGADLSYGMLHFSKAGVPVLQGDGSRMPLPDASIDGVTCGFALRNFADLATVLAELGRVVRPGGRIALLEVSTPTSPLLKFGHNLWFTQAVPRIGALLSDGRAYEYLPRSVAYLPDPPALAAMVRGSGFSTVNRHTFLGGSAQLLTATRTEAPVSVPDSASLTGAAT